MDKIMVKIFMTNIVDVFFEAVQILTTFVID